MSIQFTLSTFYIKRVHIYCITIVEECLFFFIFYNIAKKEDKICSFAIGNKLTTEIDILFFVVKD